MGCFSFLFDISYLPYDIINNGKFNDSDVVNHEEAKVIVSNYSYGIGVGRAALEMLAMGLKVIIAGKHYGGVLTSDELFERHTLHNMNSTLQTGGDVMEDFKKLEDSDWKVDIEKIDMRNRINDYLEILLK